MRYIILLIILNSFSLSLLSQTECPSFGKKKSRSLLSNDKQLYCGIDIFSLVYADNPWIFSVFPHIGINLELNILRHLSIGGSVGSQFKLQFNTDLPVFEEPYRQNIYFKFNTRIYINKAYDGMWIGYTQTLDNELKGIKLLELGYSNKVSKIGVINYFVGTTIERKEYFMPRYISTGITLGFLKKKTFF